MLDVGREINKAFIDAATNVSATLDGQPLQVTRLVSEVFDATVPADNIFNALLGGPEAGTYQNVNEGLYAKVAPLSTGRHELKLNAQSGPFLIDVTYRLIVTPGR